MARRYLDEAVSLRQRLPSRAFTAMSPFLRILFGAPPLVSLALVPLTMMGCGGAVSASPTPPPDAGTGTSQPALDSGQPSDAAAPIQQDSTAPSYDAAPPPDTSVPVGPGVLLFAGWGEAPLNDTWNWDGTIWTELDINGPSDRSDQSMIGVNGTVLLFGGEGLGPYLGDTWQWNSTPTWTQLNVTGPSAREGAATGVLNGKVYLYGGAGTASPFLSDMWEWDGTTWTELTFTGPTPGQRYGASMATLGNNLVLFGNVGGPTDTWTFDGTSWTQAATVGPTGNPGGLSDSRCFQGMATLGDKVILFGGEQDANDILNDTWSWDGTSWTELSIANAPAARFHPGMTTFQDEIVMFGGAGAIPDGAPFLADTWTFDGTTWTQVPTSGPSGRYGYVLAAH
jgi:hypothetical protein